MKPLSVEDDDDFAIPSLAAVELQVDFEPIRSSTPPTLPVPERTAEMDHEWLGAEEVNDWFIASCSCGWTYQHPNYGTTQETFVNHWGDHIIAAALDLIEGKPK